MEIIFVFIIGRPHIVRRRVIDRLFGDTTAAGSWEAAALLYLVRLAAFCAPIITRRS
jgi:hypothetical protein